MAKGAEAKAQIIDKILNTFEGSFLYNGGKELRIPVEENGVSVQIKIALTCAKDNVEPGAETALPGVKVTTVSIKEGGEPEFKDASELIAPSAEELNAVSDMLASLGL